MDEENKIQEGEIENLENSENQGVLFEDETGGKKKRKTDLYIEVALLFILGVLIGVAVKTEAAKKITVGFNDYKIKSAGSTYNINSLQAELMKKINDQKASQNSGAAPAGDQAAPEQNAADQNITAPEGNQSGGN